MTNMSEPVTRTDLDSALMQLRTSLETSVDTKLTQLLTTLDERLDTKLERLETRLVSQFWDWARPREKRERAYRARLSAAEAQLVALQERVRLIEDRDAPAPPNSPV